jgi:hypothetical protein
LQLLITKRFQFLSERFLLMRNMTKRSGKSIVKVRFNEQKYTDLLADTLPKVIETEKQNRRLLKVLNGLMRKGKDRTPEETELAKLLGSLIQEFELRFYKPRKLAPREILIGLMEMNHSPNLFQ